jgi:hypothetical protein
VGKSLKNKKVRAFDQPSTDHKKKKKKRFSATWENQSLILVR